MKFRFLFLLLINLILAAGNHSFAQLVSPDVFLQGAYLEIGQDTMGAFGTCTSPAGYHPHVSGTALAEVYDYGHDGWTVGAPPYMGDYTEPGDPVEGWSVEIAGTEYKNWVNGTLCAGSFGIPGSNTGYTNSGGRITANWTGAILGLSIIAETRVDTFASAVVVTVRFYNTTASPITDVYYERMCDPDNASTWGMGSATYNVIVHQNEDARHDVLVSSVADSDISGVETYELFTYMGLGTKDCRAKCGVLTSGLAPLNIPSTIFGEFPPDSTRLGDSSLEDVGIILVYSLGNIAPYGSSGDSAVISFAYIFNQNTGIDSAFPDPQLLVDTTLEPNAPEPLPSHDTFSTCAYPGLITMPVKVLNATDKNWTWSTWTWSPSTGLASTTGVNNTLNIAALSGPTTYTITGTDSAVNMMSCNYRVFYLTVIPCFNVTSNSPGPAAIPGDAICISDTLKLHAHGDSTGATYTWYGPGGFMSTGDSTFRTGLTLADTGTYYGVKTVGASHDTASTFVVLKPLPIVRASSNGPICSGGTNVLNLTGNPDSTGETFVWSGPVGFTSTLQDPSTTGLPTSSTGIYKVVTTLNGCIDSNTVSVIIDSTPAVPTISSNAPVCSQRDTLKFTSGDATPGVNYTWIGPLGFTSALQNPFIAHVQEADSGIYTVTATISYDGISCNSKNTIDDAVDSTPYLPIAGSNGPNICTGTPLLLTATSTAGSSYNWTGPDLFTSPLQNPTISPAPTVATGNYYVAATLFYPGIPGGCISDTASVYVAIDSTPVIPTAGSNSPGAPGPVLCQGDTLRLSATDTTAGVSYTWAGPDAFTSTNEYPVIPNVYPAATGTYTVTATLGICAASAVTTVSITPTPPLTVTNNGPVCTGVQDTMLLQAVCAPGATYSWTGPYTFFSSNQNPYRTPVIMEYGGIYQVTASLYGCASEVVNDTVIVRQTPAPPIVPWLAYCQFYSAPPLQAMGDSILWYPTDVPGATGSLTAPVPPTSNTGTSWYYATQTLMGCTSYLDSIKVIVNAKPVVKASSDTAVCPHKSLTLTAVDTDPIAYYHWAPFLYITDSSSPSITVMPETDVIYSVVATNQFDCTDTAYVTVNVLAGAVLNLGDSVTLYPGQSYQLNPLTNCSSFSWFPPAGLSNANISNPVASPGLSTIYIVQGETSWGCIAVDSISIYVNTESILVLPNAFTPGNGPNSEFKIIKSGEATLNYFRIFDRWGVKVFETTDINMGWDGTYNGTPQLFGVYVYEVSAVTGTGTQLNKHGNVTLIR